MAKTLTAAAVARLKGPREVPDGGCPGLYLAIRDTGGRSWNFRYRRPDRRPAKLVLGSVDVSSNKENGGEPVLGGHLTLAAARVLATEARRQVALGHDPGAMYLAEKERRRVVAIEKAAKTFATAARQFIDEHKVPRQGRKPRHWREVARILGLAYPQDGGEPTEIDGGLAARWRDKPVSEIDGHDIHALIDEARRRGIPGLERRNTSVSDVRGGKMANALGGLFGFLLQHRRIAVDPTVGVWRPSLSAPRQRVLNTKIDIRKADELRFFCQACGSDAVGAIYGALFKLLLLTGCRRDEIGELRWESELSDDLAMIRLPGSRTKNGRPHEVPLPPLARDLLRGLRKIEGCQWVFTVTGKRLGNYAEAKRKLDAAMLALARAERGKDATIEPFVLHDLRRTCATGMASIGVQPHIIEACLNHVSGAKGGIAGVYNVEQYAKEKKAAFQRWAAHIEGIVSGKPTAKILPLQPGRARS
jgi:integrase